MPNFADITVGNFVKMAASDRPTPGGGGIAALAGALGGAMASMAANFTVGKPKYAEHEERMRGILDELGAIIPELVQAIDDDAEAFNAIGLVYKLPRDTDEEKAKRKQAIDKALTGAMRVPLRIACLSLRAARLLPSLAEAGNPNLLSDVEVAGIMLEAAARAARVNVEINSTMLTGDEAREAEKKSNEAVEEIAALSAQTASIIHTRRSAT